MVKAKNVEQFLISCVGLDAWRDKRTRNFIKKTSKNIEKMYKAGLRDSKAGERRVSREELHGQNKSESELVKSVLDLAYSSYLAGYGEGEGG